MTENEHYFGEWAEYRSPEEREEAYIYLQSWKKFFIRKAFPLEIINEDIIDRYPTPATIDAGLISTLGIKIHMTGEKPENVISLSDLDKMQGKI